MMTPGRFKMKDLERATGVGRETIRFYIGQGLLPEPERPRRNVAYYGDSHIERLRLIKELQRKRFLPLHVIKAIVNGDARPPEAEIETLQALDGKLFRNLRASSGAMRMSEVARRTGVSATDIRGLAEVGVLTLTRRDGAPWLDADGVRIVDLWGRMRRGGFTDALGFGPEHLRLYVDLVQVLAREELRMFTHGVTGHVAAERTAKMAELGIDTLNELIGVMRKAVMLRFIAEGNVPPATGDPRDLPG